jgi:hypothetical protein
LPRAANKGLLENVCPWEIIIENENRSVNKAFIDEQAFRNEEFKTTIILYENKTAYRLPNSMTSNFWISALSISNRSIVRIE